MSAKFIAHRIYMVVSRPPRWAVELVGRDIEIFETLEEALALARRRAQASRNWGTPAEVRVVDEPQLAPG